MFGCCKPANMNKNTFLVSLVLHVLILLTILTVFYFEIVHDISMNALQSEVSSAIGSAANLVDPTDRAAISKILQPLLPFDKLDQMINYYKNNRTDEYTLTNRWLKTSAISSICILAVFLLCLSAAMRNISGKGAVQFKHIAIENICVFTLVGAVEATFFLTVAKRFVPVLPSTLTTTFVQQLKAGLAKKI